MTFTVRTHRCEDVDDFRTHRVSEASESKARYWANPEKFRAQARARYAKHRLRYAAAALARKRARLA